MSSKWAGCICKHHFHSQWKRLRKDFEVKFKEIGEKKDDLSWYQDTFLMTLVKVHVFHGTGNEFQITNSKNPDNETGFLFCFVCFLIQSLNLNPG